MNVLGDHPGASVEGPSRIYWNNKGMTVITFGEALVLGSDENTTLSCLGRGDVTFVAGDGNNIANGGVGNDIFIGAAGYNRFYGDAGDDLLVGGNFINELSGGKGNDTIVFGQGDQVSGGPDGDHFILTMKPDTRDDNVLRAEFTYIRDLNFKEGDVLDLSVNPDFLHGNMKIMDNALMVFGPQGTIQIEGVGNEITMAGGIDAAIRAGELVVYDTWNLMTPFGISPEELTLIGVEPPSVPGFTTPAKG